MKNQYLGIDIGGTAVKFGFVDADGNIIHSSQYSVAFDAYETPILNTVLTSSKKFLDEFSISLSSLAGIGISATGQIDSFKGIVSGSGGHIKNWVGAALKESFETEYNLPVTVVNDANCVAIGEKWIGAAKDKHNVLVLTIGTGLGGGIIINDNILLGASGFAGELGHFSIDSHGRSCTCGNVGCFEQYASMTSLVKDVHKFYEDNEPELLQTVQINGKYIFDEIQKGNVSLENIVHAWTENISKGIVSLVHIFNPELVVIGGGVSVQETLFISKLREKVMKKLMPNFAKGLEIKAAELGNNAGLVGAVYYLKQTMNI